MGSSESYEKLLAAAERLVLLKGCNQTTIKDIMLVSGLSKGGIYHYISSKDDLFIAILKKRLHAANQSFFQSIDLNAEIDSTHSSDLFNPENASNKIFMYLLGQLDDDKIAAAMKEFVHEAQSYTEKWILNGQFRGSISSTINAKKTSHLLMLIIYGLRIRNSIEPNPTFFTIGDLYELIFKLLKNK